MSTLAKPWVVDSTEKAERILAFLHAAPCVGLDTETYGVDPTAESPVGTGRIACWSVAIQDNSLPLNPRTGNPQARGIFLWAKHLPVFKQWLEDPKQRKVLHNGFTFDRHIFANEGINLQGIEADTLRVSKLLYSSKLRKHGLKPQMDTILGYQYGDYKDLFSRPKHKEDFKQWYKTVKKEKVPIPFKMTHRKILGKKIPTCSASGQFFTVYKDTELIPLDTIQRDYPSRLEDLYQYASLDAKATLELWWYYKPRMEAMEWVV